MAYGNLMLRYMEAYLYLGGTFCDYKNLSSWGFVVFSKHIPQSDWRKESSNGLQELLVLPWTNFGFIVNSECAYVL
jgi:hypothetical protein